MLLALALFLLAFLLPLNVAADPTPQEEMFTLINDHRAEHGLQPLLPSQRLTKAAQWMARDMADGDYFGHVDSLGRGPFERMGDYGFGSDRRAENLAAGSGYPPRIFAVWRDSPAHNRNLLDPGLTVAGIGWSLNHFSTYKLYWALNLGGCWDCPRPYPQWRWP